MVAAYLNLGDVTGITIAELLKMSLIAAIKRVRPRNFCATTRTSASISGGFVTGKQIAGTTVMNGIQIAQNYRLPVGLTNSFATVPKFAYQNFKFATSSTIAISARTKVKPCALIEVVLLQILGLPVLPQRLELAA